MRKLPAHIEDWSDERSIGNPIMITLARGWSFYRNEHSGVQGFDTVKEAREETAKKRLYPCSCPFCKGETDKA